MLKADKIHFKNGHYETPVRKISLFARLFPAFAFYSTVLNTVVNASKLARRGELTDQQYEYASVEIMRAVEKVGGQIEVDNLDVVRESEWPYVFVANHMSTLETMALACLLLPKGPINFVVKESLLNYPVFGHVMRSRNPIVVGRENPRQDLVKVLEEGKQRLAQGYSVIVFPQRTRTKDFNPAQFNSIGVKLARRANRPVVPVAIKTDFWGSGKLVKELGKIDPNKKVRFHFGQPIHIKGRGTETHEQIVSFISEKISKWKEEK